MADFSKIIGHEKIKEHMTNAAAAGKVSHAYILSGEDKSGKMMLAEAFAQTLQCEQGGAKPCNECHSCKQAISHNQPDIIYVEHEKPNTISVEDIRQQVNADVVVRPYSSKYKIYIIDEAEKMNTQAQNALLKTIEEPPEYVIILLLTTNAELFLPTILSRCVTLNLHPVDAKLLRSFLMQNYEIPDYQADICVAFAQGNVGKAIDLACSSEFNELKEQVLQVLKRIDQMQEFEVIDAIRRIHEYNLEIRDYFDLMMVWYRDVLLYKATADVNGLIFKDEIYAIKDQANRSGYEQLNEILEAIKKAQARVVANVNFDLVVELLLWTIKRNMG
ncbi:ATP-binding protein [Eubacterium oxidoreducens]|uniref:DNA polymerase III subunit delta' n=1 Tax=Eubacterium oxidoreducens TaxID=1732 RepID=A0A1G5ZZS2_EUBOX|nr:AAA family ATPase [Eubacterium oxidoreducens]SDB01645.1 DNA polymerase-3 subunit delta' [Eubacterium oxidoreducens]